MMERARAKLVVGNWKMHGTPSETEARLMEIISRLGNEASDAAAGARVEIVIAPPFTSLPLASRLLAGTGIGLCAQDCHWEEEGPYTGETSARMLAEIGCTFVILGHSERRELCGETDQRIARKAVMALFWGLTPVICVGEKRDERDSGRAEMVVEAQLKRCLEEVKLDRGRRLAIAYEPVWAIGTGRQPSPSDVRSVHQVIRDELVGTFGETRGGALPILYGGSVTPFNVAPMVSPDVADGVLAGGASLKPDSFLGIIRQVRLSAAQRS